MKYLGLSAAICITLGLALMGAYRHLTHNSVPQSSGSEQPYPCVRTGENEYTCTLGKSHANEASWAIQGIYSQLDCASQPGARPWYIENEGRSWYMGCQ